MLLRQKITVTGASGQLGLALKVLSSAYPQFQFDFLSRDRLSITDREGLRNYFKSHSPQYFINCAAYTAVDQAEAEKDLAYSVNSEAVKNIAILCREFNSKLIHISTDYVFDGTASRPYTEEDLTAPQNIYGSSKLEGEKQAIRENAESIIIRTSWVYAATGKNFVNTMLRLMMERPELKIVSDQIGSPTCAPDLALAIMRIIGSQQWIPGIYHFSNEGAISWYEFAQAIKEMISSNCNIIPIPTSEYPTAARRPLYTVLEKRKIQNIYRIELRNWKERLRDCLLDLDSK